MLELRLPADTKRIAAMVAAIRSECLRAQTTLAHADAVALVAAGLVGGDGDATPGGRSRRRERAPEVLVIVTVQSDATLLMVRETRPASGELGEGRRRLLDAQTLRWSTVSGRDGRTVWTEIARTAPIVVSEPAAVPAPVPVPRPVLAFAD
jgi:hypothetical protein